MTFLPAQNSASYYLSPDVYVGVRDDRVVFFDTAQGKYLTANASQSRQLACQLHGWPSPPVDITPELERAPPVSSSASAARFLERLVQRGLLTQDPRVGKPAVPIRGQGPMDIFPIFPLDPSLRPYLSYLPRFLGACARAKWLLRNISVPKIAERIRVRRRRWGNQPLDDEKLKTLVRAHHHLRPLVYTAQDACLYDSLVLLEFLARYRVDAIWVFGIHSWPWILHCWVRTERYLLNDTPGRIVGCSILAEF